MAREAPSPPKGVLDQPLKEPFGAVHPVRLDQVNLPDRAISRSRLARSGAVLQGGDGLFDGDEEVVGAELFEKGAAPEVTLNQV